VREKQDMSSLLQTITDNTAASLFLVDAEGRCTFMNPSGERLLGYTFAEIEGAVLHDKIHFLRPDGTHYHPGDCRMMAALASRTRLSAYEDTMVRKDGTFAPVLCVVSPIVQEGAPIATVIEMHDIGDRKRAEQESLQRAQKEVLLGKIGLAIRNSLMPEDIEHTATGLLGQALTADRCYVVTVDLELDYVRFGSDWHRRDLKALSGMQRPSEFDDYMMSRFSGGKTLVIDDIAQGDLPVPANGRRPRSASSKQSRPRLERPSKPPTRSCASSASRRLCNPPCCPRFQAACLGCGLRRTIMRRLAKASSAAISMPSMHSTRRASRCSLVTLAERDWPPRLKLRRFKTCCVMHCAPPPASPPRSIS
jgi:PAS domain S-box-containing protein